MLCLNEANSQPYLTNSNAIWCSISRIYSREMNCQQTLDIFNSNYEVLIQRFAPDKML